MSLTVYKRDVTAVSATLKRLTILNGTMLTTSIALHFKLALEKQGSKRYEDMMFSYQPQLQDDRDAELIETLPEFLLEDIEFKRPQGPNFYSRVIKGLVDKRREE